MQQQSTLRTRKADAPAKPLYMDWRLLCALSFVCNDLSGVKAVLKSKKKWKFSADTNIDPVWQGLTLSPVTKKLLVQRGIENAEAAARFLHPSPEHLHEPALFHDMGKACERVRKAIREGEKILVYGDYDADGVTSTTVMLETLEELGAFCDFYIPNRFTEGYGPNESAFRLAHDAGASLIITVDNGISGVHEAAVAKELGMDLIITDHHEVQGEVPDAYAVIHPKCSPDYPFKELAGVGVAFKFAESLLGYYPEKFLDLVAIGTVADLVPLADENRILVHEGLKVLGKTERAGLQALKETAKIENPVTEEDIGFLIGPRLNAVGRLQDADLAVELLRAEDPLEAKELAETVQELNQERQKIVAAIAKEAEKKVLEREGELPGVIVVAAPDWNEGVLGIVASKLVRTFDRPAIVLREKEDGLLKGSARSIPAFDLFEACMQVRDLFEGFGGHSQAAGMTLKQENREALERHLDERIKAQLSEDEFRDELLIAASLEMDHIDETLVREVDMLRPFGMHNPKPLFHFCQIPKETRQLGNLNKHLKLQFSENGQTVEGIGFGFGELYPVISPDVPVSVVGELGVNEWNGYRKMQIVIRDMEIDAWQLFDYRGKQGDVEPLAAAAASALAVGKAPNGNQLVEQANYQEALKAGERETLVLYDLPTDLAMLEAVVQSVRPNQIYACFHVENGAYLSGFPPREAFKWLYAYILKKGEVSLKNELAGLMKHKGWSKDWIIFMASVFRDLGFINIENSIARPNAQPAKRQLDESEIYQSRLKQAEIEKVLYYSTYKELKNWFAEQCALDAHKAKREFAHGL